MATDRTAMVKRLATEALNDLADPRLSLEISIRKAVRVAALERDAWWKTFLQLQLTDLKYENTDMIKEELVSAIGPIRDDVFAVESTEKEAQSIFEGALGAYFASRTIPSQKDKFFGKSVGQAEAILKELSKSLDAVRSRVPDNLMIAFQEQQAIINRIRNLVQGFLISIESRD